MGKMWEIEVVEPLVMVWGSRGVYRIREIGVSGRKGRGFFFFLSEDLWVWGSNGRECDSISINFK